MSGSATQVSANAVTAQRPTVLPTQAPRCFIEVYPFEGGAYNLGDDNPYLLSVSTTSTVRGFGGGFAIALSPSGPNGINTRPSWAEIITPKSLVVIGLRRGPYARIVMVGVVATTQETSVRQVGQSIREIIIQGDSFSTFFNSYSFYNLITQMVIGLGVLGDAGYIPALCQAAAYGTPDSISRAWYEKIMTGTGGILSRTQFAYKGTEVKFGDIISTNFEPYDSKGIIIPQNSDFLGAGSFAQKFQGFCPFPWYETFVTTAPVGNYADIGGYTAAKTPIQMNGFQDASPTFVCRLNPLPTTTADVTNYSAGFKLNYDKWIALPSFSLSTHGHKQFDVVYDDSEVRNFYVINPLLLARFTGDSASSNNPFMYTYSGWIDNASIHRYGYRPQITETYWFADPNGIAAQHNAANATENEFHQLVADLALQVTAYHQPTPLMARASITIELRPDIMEGTKFSHIPYRDGVVWDYYVEAVSHSFSFGDQCTTTLSLTRGLPHSVYEDPDLLLSIHLGNAQKVNGNYQSGLPAGLGDPLSVVLYNSVQHLLADNALMWNTPQANTPATNPLH